MDKGKMEVQLEVRDSVFLKIQPYCFQSLATQPNEKLNPCYYKPYEVLERVGRVAYKLFLPLIAIIHPIFLVSQLKKQVGLTIVSQPLLDCPTKEGELEVQLLEILDYRYSSKGELETPSEMEGIAKL